MKNPRLPKETRVCLLYEQIISDYFSNTTLAVVPLSA